MKRIAIVTPCVLPVPATCGGAVEELITRVIRDNELNSKSLIIDVFSIADEKGDNDWLECTHVVSIEYTAWQEMADRILDKIHRSVDGSEGYRLFDTTVAKAFENRLSELDEPYEAVIVENQVTLAQKIVEVCRRDYEFPVYFHMHNDVDIYRSPKGLKDLADHGVIFLVVSEYLKARVLKHVSNAVIFVLYNGTTISEAKLSKADENTNVRFLYAGRVIADKGVLELVEAFGGFLEMISPGDRDRYSLDIIGFSNETSKYEKKVLQLAQNFNANISCKERVSTEEMKREYGNYDVVVMPTLVEESFGMVALETMSQGLPLIISDSGALPEVARDGALIASRGDDYISNLANAIHILATDETFRAELANKAYLRARELEAFNIQNYYSSFIGIIDNNNDNGKISVVVPVYNVSEYLKICMESLLGQTYTNTEILLIDDGSTDNSGMLCDEYAQKDSRVKVIHQKNQGLSGARNTGIDQATGDYLFFCDSDDFLHKDALNYMHDKICRDKADIVACGFSHVWEDFAQSGREEIFTDPHPGIFSGRAAVKEMMTGNNVCSVAWNKLYRKSLFTDVRFPVGALHEDEATVYKLLYGAKIVSYTPKTFYKYFQRTSGIMGGSLGKRGKHLLSAFTDRVDFFEERNDTELTEYSRIALLEHIKYIYRNVDDERDRRELARVYGDNISFRSAPVAEGNRKRVALLLWKYIKY